MSRPFEYLAHHIIIKYTTSSIFKKKNENFSFESQKKKNSFLLKAQLYKQ